MNQQSQQKRTVREIQFGEVFIKNQYDLFALDSKHTQYSKKGWDHQVNCNNIILPKRISQARKLIGLSIHASTKFHTL